jgi:hypothetical protein
MISGSFRIDTKTEASEGIVSKIETCYDCLSHPQGTPTEVCTSPSDD